MDDSIETKPNLGQKLFKFNFLYFFIILTAITFGVQFIVNKRNYQSIYNLKTTTEMANISHNGETVLIGLKHSNNNQAGSIIDINVYNDLNLFIIIPEELTSNHDFLKEYQPLMDSLRKFLNSDGFTKENFFLEVPKFQTALDEVLHRYGNYQNITRLSSPKFNPHQTVQYIEYSASSQNHRFYDSYENFLNIETDLSGTKEKQKPHSIKEEVVAPIESEKHMEGSSPDKDVVTP